MDVRRLTFVTGSFYQLQGLRLVPLGMFLLALAALTLGWMDWLPGRPPTSPSSWGNAWVPALFCAAIISAIGSEDVYIRRYGLILQHPRTLRNKILGVGLLFFCAFALLDIVLRPPILLSALVVWIALSATAFADRPLRTYYAVIGAGWLILSALPALDLTGVQVRAALYAGGGVSLLLCGIGDHLLLTRTLGRTG